MNKKKFGRIFEKLETIVNSKPVDKKSNNFQENHSLWMPTIGIKQNPFTLLVCDLEIL